MSSRLHNKFHRHNHHTYGSLDPRYPDSSHDPIASKESPFFGDFVLLGPLSCFSPLSSYAAYFFNLSTAVIISNPNFDLQNMNLSSFAVSSVGNIVSVGSISSTGNFYGAGDILNYGSVFLQGPPNYLGHILGNTTTLTIYGDVSSDGNFLQEGTFTAHGTNALTGINTIYGNNTITGWGELSSYGTNTLRGTNTINGNNTITGWGTLSAYGTNTLNGTNTITGTNVIVGTNTISGGFTDYGDVTIYGNLNVIGSATRLQSFEKVLSSVSIDVTNYGWGVALAVNQAGDADVINFKDDGVTKLFIAGDSTKTNDGYVGINTNNPTNQLTVIGQVTSGNDAVVYVKSNTTQSGYVKVQSTNNGVSASADFTATNNLGDFFDIGINSSGWVGASYGPAFTIAGPRDAYAYSSSTANDLALGTSSSSGDLILFAGGTLSGTSINSGNERIRVKSTGNVGVNTAYPNKQLTVYGDISASNTGTIYSRYGVIDSSYGKSVNINGNDKTLNIQSSSTASGYVSIQNQYTGISASTDLSIYNSANAYIDVGINSDAYNGNSYSPTFNITNANDGYIYTNSTANNFVLGTQSTTGDLVLFTGGALSGTTTGSPAATPNERLRIKSGGNVGINTSNPNNTLTVVGTISSTNTATLSNVVFTGAQVQTFADPITATGDFLVLTINGKQRAIQLWNF
jgi:hypothetical protein